MTEPNGPRRSRRGGGEAAGRRPLLVNGEALRQTLGRPGRGFGEPFRPFSVEENRERLIPQVAAVHEALEEMPVRLRGTEVIVEARLLPQALAASSFPDDLFNAAGLVHVGTKPDRADTFTPSGEPVEEAPTKTVYLAVSDNLGSLRAILDGKAGRQTRRAVENIQALDAIQLPEPFIVTGDEDEALASPLKRDEDGLVLYEAVLHGQPSPSGRVVPADRRTRTRFREFIETELEGRIEGDFIRPAGTLLFVPVRVRPDVVASAAQFNALRAVQPMARLRRTPANDEAQTTFTEPSAAVEPVGEPLRVAVFDCGVDESSPFWQNRVASPIVGSLVPDSGAQRHGALVTSAMLYGHIEGTELPEPANMTITHYATLPQAGWEDDLEMYWLLDVITQQVEANDYDVVTVCAAPDRIVTNGPVDRWTSTLDNLAHDNGVLFVVAAGNNGAAPSHGGLNRILVPGDATNVLTVGAADSPVAMTRRAAYSAVGPGRAGAEIRPSGLAFGGTHEVPFSGVDNDGTKLTGQGTSYAAPLLTHSLADLADTVGRERISPVTMRAFTLHFARDCATKDLLEVGHGHFVESYAFLLDGPENEAHVLYRGTIARTEFVPLSIPVPDSRQGRLEVRYTLVTSTATEPSDSVDYTKAGLDVVFRPHINRYTLSKAGHRTVTADSTSREFRSYVRDNYIPASEPKTDSISVRPKNEGQLRAEGKWDSVRMGRHRYRDAEDKLFRPRIELSHLARESGILVDNVPDLDWALLVTLRAQPGVNLYDDVRAQYQVLTMLPAPTITVGTRTA